MERFADSPPPFTDSRKDMAAKPATIAYGRIL